jgi:hypothetical protein
MNFELKNNQILDLGLDSGILEIFWVCIFGFTAFLAICQRHRHRGLPVPVPAPTGLTGLDRQETLTDRKKSCIDIFWVWIFGFFLGFGFPIQIQSKKQFFLV